VFVEKEHAGKILLILYKILVKDILFAKNNNVVLESKYKTFRLIGNNLKKAKGEEGVLYEISLRSKPVKLWKEMPMCLFVKES